MKFTNVGPTTFRDWFTNTFIAFQFQTRIFLNFHEFLKTTIQCRTRRSSAVISVVSVLRQSAPLPSPLKAETGEIQALGPAEGCEDNAPATV